MKTFEHLRTTTEVLRDTMKAVYSRDTATDDSCITKVEKALAEEVAAGELAHAMLRRRIRELERHCNHVLAPLDAQCIHCGADMRDVDTREQNCFGTRIPGSAKQPTA